MPSCRWSQATGGDPFLDPDLVITADGSQNGRRQRASVSLRWPTRLLLQGPGAASLDSRRFNEQRPKQKSSLQMRWGHFVVRTFRRLVCCHHRVAGTSPYRCVPAVTVYSHSPRRPADPAAGSLGRIIHWAVHHSRACSDSPADPAPPLFRPLDTSITVSPRPAQQSNQR